jgi:hypothetical protein
MQITYHLLYKKIYIKLYGYKNPRVTLFQKVNMLTNTIPKSENESCKTSKETVRLCR